MSLAKRQSLEITSHHAVYDGINPEKGLQGRAAGKVVYITGASRGI